MFGMPTGKCIRNLWFLQNISVFAIAIIIICKLSLYLSHVIIIQTLYFRSYLSEVFFVLFLFSSLCNYCVICVIIVLLIFSFFFLYAEYKTCLRSIFFVILSTCPIYLNLDDLMYFALFFLLINSVLFVFQNWTGYLSILNKIVCNILNVFYFVL